MTNVLEYLERSAERFPEKTAFADPDAEITYEGLVRRAKRIGTALAALQEPGKPVPVFMGKGVDTIAAFMGAVYAGCFYCLVDTHQPLPRFHQIMETLETDFILTSHAWDEELSALLPADSEKAESPAAAKEESFTDTESPAAAKAESFTDAESPAAAKEESFTDTELPAAAKAGFSEGPESRNAVKAGTSADGNLLFRGKIVYLEDLEKTETDESLLAEIRAKALDIDPLYCNFTSGSTGVPKGVAVCHRSVIDFMECFTKIFGLTENDILGNQAPFDFDVSVKDIYSTLKCGATMEIIPTKYFSIPMQLLDFLTERRVTVLIWAVSALCIISQLHGFDYKVPSEVKKVLFSGEVMPVRHLILWQEALPDAQFVNLYGPTEITCNCTYYTVDHKWKPGEVLPSGIPFPNERVFLLDENDRLITERNVTGELCVSGTALALGYYNNPEQTARAFVQNPLNKNFPERIYRTGDLAFYNENGEFCFASRRDFQIKHMGHRIELGEIDAAFDGVPEVGRACCIYENNRIIAFYTGEIERKELSQALSKTLPNYMIPNVFVKKDRLPLTKNGKIDRKALAEGYHKK